MNKKQNLLMLLAACALITSPVVMVAADEDVSWLDADLAALARPGVGRDDVSVFSLTSEDVDAEITALAGDDVSEFALSADGEEEAAESSTPTPTPAAAAAAAAIARFDAGAEADVEDDVSVFDDTTTTTTPPGDDVSEFALSIDGEDANDGVEADVPVYDDATTTPIPTTTTTTAAVADDSGFDAGAEEEEVITPAPRPVTPVVPSRVRPHSHRSSAASSQGSVRVPRVRRRGRGHAVQRQKQIARGKKQAASRSKLLARTLESIESADLNGLKKMSRKLFLSVFSNLRNRSALKNRAIVLEAFNARLEEQVAQIGGELPQDVLELRISVDAYSIFNLIHSAQQFSDLEFDAAAALDAIQAHMVEHPALESLLRSSFKRASEALAAMQPAYDCYGEVDEY